MKLTYYGHSCFLIETAGKRLLFDPFITPNQLAAKVEAKSIKCDYIVVSHAHSDHVADIETVLANNPEATLISIWEITQHYNALTGCKWHAMNTGGTFQFDFGELRCTAAVHSSSFADGKYGGNPVGYVIKNDEAVLYFSGDTGLTMDMQILPMVTGQITAAILPIGGNFTMNAKDAFLAAEFIHCDQVIGCHYDTFPWIEVDHEAAQRVFAEGRKTLYLLPIGDSLEI
jgi:L-ascorbate metabolism protein UlaG (beta-lactamase superfamily)